MGEPVSIEMTAFEYVRSGFPDPIRYTVNPDEITPEQWQTLIADELWQLRPILRDMLGFRPWSEVLAKELVPYTGAVHRYDTLVDKSLLCRLMMDAYIDLGMVHYFLLDRNGHWLLWRSKTTIGKSGKRAVQASLTRLSDDDLLVLLRQDAKSDNKLGLYLLRSLDTMVRSTIEERNERLRALTTYYQSQVGQAFGRINYWK